MPYLTIYTPSGRLPRAVRSMKQALVQARSLKGPFVILERSRKFAYPHAANAGMDGVCHARTMLLYPPDAKCRFRPDEYIIAHGCSLNERK